MPAAIPWNDGELQALVLTSPESRVFVEQKRIPVVLQPFHLKDLKSAVRDLLNASVDSYDKLLDGVLLGYKHLKLLSQSASVSAESSGVVLDIQADFYIFRPENGCILKGIVNKISKDHVGVLLYQRFNISCPRPSSEARSEKWLGNHVSMHQEVMFKLKEKNFSGTLPFFRGKLLSCGRVIPVIGGEEKKSKKKKEKEKQDKASNVSENVRTAVPSTLKNPKHKLEEESEGSSKTAAKRLKKEDKPVEPNPNETPSKRNLKLVEVPAEPSSSRKKSKKNSLGCASETDFIPRFSLNVSQLPDHLPPPNADSTHFDFGKTSPNLNKKSEKKKKKDKEAVLSAVSEVSSQKPTVSSNAGSNLDNSMKKNLVSGPENIKKKKGKKMELQEGNIPEEPTLLLKTDFKGKDKKKTLNVQQVIPSTKHSVTLESVHTSLQDNVKTKKHKMEQPVHDEHLAGSSSKKLKKAKKLDAASIQASCELIQQDGLMKLTQSKDGTKTSKDSQSSSKLKRKKLNDIEGSPTKSKEIPSVISLDPQAMSKSKKKQKQEEQSFSTPLKQKKYEKRKDMLEMNKIDAAIASDDTIPPGQKTLFVSPLKRNSVTSPKKHLMSNTSTLNYFPASYSMVNLDFGERKGSRPSPLMFGSVDGKVVFPQESPLKLSPTKKTAKSDSDSDTSLPKKIIVSSSRRQETSDSDNSHEDQMKTTTQSPLKSKFVLKKRETSDESDSDTAVKSKLLQSMGVMQSPLKSAKSHSKHDSSDSESDSIDSSGNYKALSRSSKPKSLSKSEKPIGGVNSITKSMKSNSKSDVLSAAVSPKKQSVSSQKKAKSPKKQDKQPSQVTSSKGNGNSVIKVKMDASDSDSDLEAMRIALLAVQEKKSLQKKRTPKKTSTKEMSTLPLKKAVKKGKGSSKQEKAQSDVSGNLAFNYQGKNHVNKDLKERVIPSHNNFSSDSDSGPDDRNTTRQIEKQREERVAEEEKANKKVLIKKSRVPKNIIAKNKNDLSSVPNQILSTNSKSSKANEKKSGKTETTTDKTAKQKAKQKSADEDIADVMQRLMRQYKINV